MQGNYKKWLNRINAKQNKLQDSIGNVGVGKTDASASEKLDVNGNVKSNSYKFYLTSVSTPVPNTLVPRTDGTGLIWYDNSSVANDLAFKSELLKEPTEPWTDLTLQGDATANAARFRKINNVVQVEFTALRTGTLGLTNIAYLPIGYIPDFNPVFVGWNLTSGTPCSISIAASNGAIYMSSSVDGNNSLFLTIEFTL